MKSGVYKIENLISKKVYVGSSINTEERRNQHFKCLRKQRHSNQHLQAAWDMYGEENFNFEVIIFCAVEELEEKEQYYMDLYDVVKTGYNIYPNAYSPGEREVSEETRKKLSEGKKRAYVEGGTSFGFKKGHEVTEETRKKKSLLMRDHKVTEETRQKIILTRKKGIPRWSEEEKKQMSLRRKGKPTGRSPSLETREKMSNAKQGKSGTKGIPCSPEKRTKISEANKGNTVRRGSIHSEESRQKMSEAHKGKHTSSDSTAKMLDTKRKNSEIMKEMYKQRSLRTKRKRLLKLLQLIILSKQ